MCLVASYTETEKKKQIINVLNLIDSPVNTETERQNYLYNLAFMNNMVVKGYMQERTDMDMLIYKVKDLALDYIVKQIPERCFLSYDKGLYVIYIYVSSRQYSFHAPNNHGLDFKNNYKACRWDGIKDGWSLSDAEYKKEVLEIKNTTAAENTKYAAEHKEWEINIKKLVLRKVKELKHNRQLVEDFKRFMTENITPAQKRTKTYKDYLVHEWMWVYCWKLWGKKWGFDGFPPETCFKPYLLYNTTSSEQGYAEKYFDKIKNIVKLN